jgi:cell wall-associated NlpC family hydrolase
LEKIACGDFFETLRGCRRQKAWFLPPASSPDFGGGLVRITLTIFVIAFAAGGCASVPRGPSSTPTDPSREIVGESRPETIAGEEVVRVAAGLIGTPYKFGGDDPAQGFDCSGLVFYSFDQLGIEVPRTAADLRQAAKPVAREELTPGDLVFFRSSARRVDHVGIYAGEGRFIHAPSKGAVVTYAYLDDPYYRAHFASAGRLPSHP